MSFNENDELQELHVEDKIQEVMEKKLSEKLKVLEYLNDMNKKRG